MASEAFTSQIPARRPGNRNWLWYFLILGTLTALAIGILIMFNLRQQLTPEKLKAAESKWKEKGPANYDMEVVKRLAVGALEEKIVVQVRGGKVVSLTKDGIELEPRLYRYYDMPAWFGYVDDFLVRDAEPGRPRTFTIATFDPDDGHLTHYIRRVAGTVDRVELIIKRTAR